MEEKGGKGKGKGPMKRYSTAAMPEPRGENPRMEDARRRREEREEMRNLPPEMRKAEEATTEAERHAKGRGRHTPSEPR